MSTLGLIFIGASVGARGRNVAADVRTIQEQLNALMPPGRTRLAVDGKCGPLTIGAIRSFQQVVCGMRNPDGLVEPDRKTIAAMCDSASAAKWAGLAAPPLPVDATPTTPQAPAAGVTVETPDPARVERIRQAHKNAASPQKQITAIPTPTADGEINLYEAKDYVNTPYFRRNLRAIFVNGMDTSGSTHASHAMLLSSTLRCPVYGLYNRTQCFWTDLFQCINDKLGMGAHARELPHTAAGYRLYLEAQLAAYNAAGLNLTRVQFVEALIADNVATLQLFRALRSDPLNDRRIPIYAHSQGNLITSNALFAVALADGDSAVVGRTVESYGSPCRTWPSGVRQRDHRLSLDYVTLAQVRRSTDSVYVMQSMGELMRQGDVHGFNIYMEHDPDFIINACRWTVLGLVETVDAALLAQALVELGNNTARVRRVFERLLQNHKRSADDVALKYTTRQRRVAAAQMEYMINEPVHGRPLRDALVACLTTGLWTSQEEKEMADWVMSLWR